MISSFQDSRILWNYHVKLRYFTRFDHYSFRSETLMASSNVYLSWKQKRTLLCLRLNAPRALPSSNSAWRRLDNGVQHDKGRHSNCVGGWPGFRREVKDLLDPITERMTEQQTDRLSMISPRQAVRCEHCLLVRKGKGMWYYDQDQLGTPGVWLVGFVIVCDTWQGARCCS